MRRQHLRLVRLETRLAPATFTWDGGGSDNNWTTPANWTSDLAPTPGFDTNLVFPAGAARLTAVNDFPAGTTFGRMDFRAGGYQIGGNALDLPRGITTASATAVDPLDFPRLTFGLTFGSSGQSCLFAGDANLGIVFDGPVTFNDHNLISVTGRYTINGLISGNGSVGTDGGFADLVLTAANTYLGTTNVAGGSLLVDGTLNPTTVVTVFGVGSGTAVLSGTGFVGPLTIRAGGFLAPGADGPGTLRTTELVSLGGTYQVDIAGAAAGEFDQVVAGGVNLNATNVLRLTVAPTSISPGETVRIIDNTSAAPTNGTFLGLPEGATVAVVDRVRFRITYVGGDGNDVELLTSPGPETFTWDGGSPINSFWSDAANWAGDTVPTAGSILVFPAGTDRQINANDLVADTAFESIFVAANYNISGNAIALSGGLTGVPVAPNAAGAAVVALEITLNAGVEFKADAPEFELTVGGPVNLNGFALASGGAGFVVIGGMVSGDGGLIVRQGSLTLANDNTYTGVTEVRLGNLTLGARNGLGAIGPGNDTRFSGGTKLTLAYFSGAPVASQEAFTFDGTSAAVQIVNTSLFAPLILSGPLTVLGDISAAGTPNIPVIFAGPLIGSANMFLNVVTVAASSVSPAFTGSFHFNVQVDGQAPLASVNGSLSGTGTVGPVRTAGLAAVSPGVNGVGTLTTGGLDIPAATDGFIPEGAGRLAIDVSAAGADRVNVTGTVSLGGDLFVNVPAGFVPAVGSRYRIIDNDGIDPVLNATLSQGRGEGTIVATIGPVNLRVTFRGGDGNDVELVATTTGRRIAIGAGTGGLPVVRVFADGAGLAHEFLAYDSAFRGGVRVAQGDFTGDGVDDVVTAPGPGGGPHIRVWDGATGNLLNEFFAYEAAFTGGVNVAVGDFGNSGLLKIVTGPDFGGGPLVRVFTRSGASLGQFFAYDSAFRGGATVAVGDATGDGGVDIVTGAGRTGGSHVKVFNGGLVVGQFFAFDGFFGGVNVAVMNNAVVVTPKAGGGPIVRVFSATGTLQSQFNTYPSDFRGGVTVAGRDVDGDGVAEVVTGPGSGGGPLVLALTAAGVQKGAFFAFDPAFLGGIFVG